MPDPASTSASDSRSRHFGVVGMGTMGSPMACCLLRAGYEVTVFNRTASRCQAAQAAGAAVGSSPAVLAAACDVVLLMLSDDAAVELAVCGKQGILAGGRRGLIVINSSTVHPGTNQRLAETLASREITLLDAPVTGSKLQAETGQLYFLVSGDEAAYQKCVPALEAMGRGHVHLGTVGMASAVKLGNNLMGFINLVGLVEALELVTEFGVAPEKFLQVISNSGGRSVMSDVKGPKILREDWSPDFTLELGAKDLRLVCRLAEDLKKSLPLARETTAILTRAVERFGADDTCAIARLYRTADQASKL